MANQTRDQGTQDGLLAGGQAVRKDKRSKNVHVIIYKSGLSSFYSLSLTTIWHGCLECQMRLSFAPSAASIIV